MSTAVLSLGSNVGDRLAHLQGCVTMLGDCVRVVSPVYSTVPWKLAESGDTASGAIENHVQRDDVEQGDFLNAVLLVDDPDTDALEWLRRGQRCEAAAGRTREIRWGPRTLDVDVIDVRCGDSDELHRDDPDMTLPHPRAHQRAFVLVPWLDVAPSAVLPGHGPVAELVAALPSAQLRGLRRRDDLVVHLAIRSPVRPWEVL
ncbi:MAG: 2-amino-4-hydroxy-6-hydroxymethyldihydropteridine diphosphokinase [Pseudonocardiaceae bacterium]